MEKSDGKKKKTSLIESFISGSFFSEKFLYSSMSVILVVIAMVITYMVIGYTVQAKEKYARDLGKEVTRLKTLSVTSTAERQRQTKKENVEKLIKKHHIKLKDLIAPPKGLDFNDVDSL